MWEKNENKQKKRPGLAHLKKHLVSKNDLLKGAYLVSLKLPQELMS